MEKFSIKKTVLILALFSVAYVLFAAEKNDYMQLAATGSEKEIEKELSYNSRLATQVFGSNRETFLMLALSSDRPVKIIKLCLMAGSNPTAKAKDGRTPVMYAANFCSSADTVNEVIKAGALFKSSRVKRLTAKAKNGKTAYDYAKINPVKEIYELLCSYAADPSAKEDALHEKGLTAEITFKPAEKTQEIQPEQSASETQAAAEKDTPAIPAEDTVSKPADASSAAAQKVSVSPAAEKTDEETVPRVSAENTTSKTAPAVTVNPFVEKPAANIPPETQNKIKKDIAAKTETAAVPETTPAQLEKLSPSERKNQIKQYTQTFLYDYAEEDEEESNTEEKKPIIIENPDRADENGVTLLMKAAKAGNDWDVKKLIQSGANVQKRDADGWSALMYAVRYQNNASLVETLIKSGAHIRVRNKYNTTPLLLAADYSKNPDILAMLLKNRNNYEDEVFKAFILSITGENVPEHARQAKVQLFLDMKVPVNRIWKGKTPLIYAAQYGKSTKVIQQLIDAGAKTELRDSSGKMAFDYAKLNDSLEHDNSYWLLNAAPESAK